MNNTIKLLVITIVFSIVPSVQPEGQNWSSRGFRRTYGRSGTRKWGAQRYGSYSVTQPEPEPEPGTASDSRTRRLVTKSENVFQTNRKINRFRVTVTTTTSATLKTTTSASTTIKLPEQVDEHLFDLRDDSEKLLLDELFDEAEEEEDSQPNIWRISPGQFEVVAAVPGEPVKSTISRLPKSVPKSIKIQPQFRPLTATPVQSTEHSPTQISEQFDRLVDLSDGLSDGNSVAQDISTDDDDEKVIRKKFRKCHGKCVQQFCLPIGNLNVYAKCVEKCKQLC